VVVASIPKSGTHLVISALRHVPGMRVCPRIVLGNVPVEDRARRIRRLGPRQVLVGHLVCDERIARALDERGAKLLLMTRDPRDVVVSLAKFVIKEHVGHRMYEYFTSELRDDDERIMACIRGVGGEHARDGRAQPDIGALYRSYFEWTRVRETHVCRFEDLVGARGGGSDEAQFEALEHLFAFLGLGLDRRAVEAVAQATFSPQSLTFRKGEIGDWTNHFTPAHRAAFREVAPGLLLQLGYEANDAW